MELEECPKCGADLTETHERNGQMMLGSRLIGVEIRGVYDGILYWVCPDCNIAFQCWKEENRLHKIAQRFIDQHNLNTLKEDSL